MKAHQTILDAGQGIRGRLVVSKDNAKIGDVDALLVDGLEEHLRYIEPAPGEFLSLGEKILIPVDAISRAEGNTGSADQSSDTGGKAPAYAPEVTSEDDSYSGLYNYDGGGPYRAEGVPPLPGGQHAKRVSALSHIEQLVASCVAAFTSDSAFANAVLTQFLFLFGVYPLQRLLLYVLEDRFGVQDVVLDAGTYLAGANA